MNYFQCDYLEGAHPSILQRLAETNFEKMDGYGEDPYSIRAREKIRAACACPDAAVHFLVGGTQTNAVVIGALLRPYEGVLAAESGHITLHEAGAIEHGGHKVITLPQTEGKLHADTVASYLRRFYADDTYQHMVRPGMVYISHPTEYGTLYTRAELEALHAVCAEYGLPLYLDGARLGYGLAAEGTDVTLPVLARTCDAFYIGGTKVGALFGEAVVLPDPELLPHFFTAMKQQGAVLAKGRLLGIQFDTLFTDGLYLHIARNAVTLAGRLKAALLEKGYRLYIDSPTNQQFFILDNQRLAALQREVKFSIWEPYDDTHTVVRLATSWATRPEELDALIALL